MTDEQFKSELSQEYLNWTERPGDCDYTWAVEEVQRLCEVIVGLRARVAELEGALKTERGALKIACEGEGKLMRDLRAVEADLDRHEQTIRLALHWLNSTDGIDFTRKTATDVLRNAIAAFDRAPTQAEPQDEGPYDGLTSTATACHNCPTKLPPEWRVRGGEGDREFSLACCMCGRATGWTKDWRGLKDWWCTNNPALPDGTKHRPADREGGER